MCRTAFQLPKVGHVTVVVSALTLIVAALTLLVAWVQLRAANDALDANNAFEVESTLFTQAGDLLDVLERADESDGPDNRQVGAAILRYESHLVAGQLLTDNGGMAQESWDDIVQRQCRILNAAIYRIEFLKAKCGD